MPLFDDFVLGVIYANASRVAALHVLAQKWGESSHPKKSIYRYTAKTGGVSASV